MQTHATVADDLILTSWLYNDDMCVRTVARNVALGLGSTMVSSRNLFTLQFLLSRLGSCCIALVIGAEPTKPVFTCTQPLCRHRHWLIPVKSVQWIHSHATHTYS